MEHTTQDGLLVLDKPQGITSRDAVDRAQRWFPPGTRLGHTGTLDPLATGVLVLCIGAATRLTEYVQRMDKVYTSTFRLGAISDTDDAEGTIELRPEAVAPDRAAVEETLRAFVGTIAQKPPAFSAIRVAGRRSYDLARKGRALDLEARPVTVHGITLLRYEFPWLEVEVHCGKGTYIRSLARDVGEQLGVGGLVQTLRRTRIGPFRVEQALSLEAEPEEVLARLRPPEEALADLPVHHVTERDAERLRQGQRLTVPPGKEGEVAILNDQGEFVAIGRVDGTRLSPVRVWKRWAD